MKLTLINPPQLFSETQVAAGIIPPLGLLYLTSYCKSRGYLVDFIDSVVEAPKKTNKIQSEKEYLSCRGLDFNEIIERIDIKSEVIGISNLFSFAFPIALELSKAIKKKHPQMIVVMGGAHVSAVPIDTLKFDSIDFVVIGEGELSFVDLLDKLKNKNNDFSTVDGLAYKKDSKIIVNPKIRYIKDLDSLPFLDREAVNLTKYYRAHEAHGPTQLKWTPIISSRGCPFQCTFCTAPKLWNRQFRARSAKNVVDEIEYCVKKYNIEEFHFEDENFTLDEERVWQICDEIKKRGLKIKWQTPNGIRASVTTIKTLKRMQEAGCYHVVFAPESGSARVLNEIMNKEQDLAKVTELVRFSSKINLKTCAFFMLGLPGETKQDVKLTIAYAKKLARLGLDEVVFSLFIPLPGSILFDSLREKGAIINNWASLVAIGDMASAKSWSEDITDKQLNRLRIKAYLIFYLNKAIFHPVKVLRMTINVIRKKQTLKTERVLITFLKRFKYKLINKKNYAHKSIQ